MDLDKIFHFRIHYFIIQQLEGKVSFLWAAAWVCFHLHVIKVYFDLLVISVVSLDVLISYFLGLVA